MDWYIQFVTGYPIFAAIAQFSILGTLGDLISKWIVQGKIYMPFNRLTLAMKMGEWALLAIFIKYAFIGYHGFVETLVQHGLLPKMGLFGNSFAISLSMNLQFGPLLVIMHRLLDNLISRSKNWSNIDKGMMSLLWFWVPAHTITFILPKPYQIGLAAIWSIALGAILGFYNKEKPFIAHPS